MYLAVLLCSSSLSVPRVIQVSGGQDDPTQEQAPGPCFCYCMNNDSKPLDQRIDHITTCYKASCICCGGYCALISYIEETARNTDGQDAHRYIDFIKKGSYKKLPFALIFLFILRDNYHLDTMPMEIEHFFTVLGLKDVAYPDRRKIQSSDVMQLALHKISQQSSFMICRGDGGGELDIAFFNGKTLAKDSEHDLFDPKLYE